MTVAAAVTAPLREMTIPRMKKGIPFIGHFDREYIWKIERPAEAGLFFCVCRAWRAASGTALSMPRRKLSAEVTRRCKSSGGLGGRNP